jgi:L-ascorbate metabolism protein UlaG (beta-lactamase superfamily)
VRNARVALALALLSGTSGCGLGADPYRGPKSAHFDGSSFHNVPEVPSRNALDVLAWQLTQDHHEWREWVEGTRWERPPARVDGGRLHITFVNHATTLVQMDGLNVLTDPIYAERASPFGFAGPRRHRPPGVPFDDLPHVDVVLVSHNHYDHMDLETLGRLVKRDHPLVIAGLGNREFLAERGIPSVELDWWQTQTISGSVKVHGVPTQHMSVRGVTDKDRTLWLGFVVEGPSGRVYFAGDTGYSAHFREARERYGAPRAALLPIGAYRPRWFMWPVHMDPREAVLAHRDLGARTSIAIHFGTFDLADEGELEPVEELRRHLSPADRFLVLDFGQGIDVP